MTLNLKEKINITKYPEDTNSETESFSSLDDNLLGMKTSHVPVKEISRIELDGNYIKFHSNLGIRIPEDGILQTVCDKGQNCLDSVKKFKTNSFSGWRFKNEHYFTRENKIIVLGILYQNRWMVEARLDDLYQNNNLVGVLVTLTKLISLKHTKLHYEDNGEVVLNQKDSKEIITPLKPFDFDSWETRNGDLSEMKIQIFQQYFDEHLQEFDSSYFFKSEEIAPPKIETPDYTYSISSNSYEEYELQNLPQDSGCFGPNEEI